MQASQTQAPYLFERFWLGMFLFYIPAFWRLLSPRSSRSERLTLLMATALFSYVPKLFRCPYYFCFSDELTWWRGVQNLLGGSPVLSDNPLGLIQGMFPGLPLLTILLQKASASSTFQVGLALMGILRVLTLISVYSLGEKIFDSSKVGSAAALVYMMNANYFFFSSQFSYESLSVPLLLATLVFLQHLLQRSERHSRIAWTLVILLNIVAIVITHHLATYMLIAILTIMTVLARLLPRFTPLRSSRQLESITLFSILAGVGWLLFTSANVVSHYGDPISRGIQQVASQTIRRLFSGIALPWYEVASGYVSAVLIVLLALRGAIILIGRRKALFAEQVGLLAFGSLYIVTAPLVLTSWGAESGRRSWVYSFISLALLSGIALAWLVQSDYFGNRWISEIVGRIASTFALSLLLLGAVATSTSISYRFPGEYLQNSDARSFTPEIIEAAQWMLQQAGTDNRVLGDRTTERIFGSYGLQEPAMYGGPRPWEVYLPTSWTPDVLYWLEDADARFVVVDKRMAEVSPQMTIRFQGGEPTSAYSDRPIPAASVEKFDELAQLDRIYDSGNLRIYTFNNTDQSLIKPGNRTGISPGQDPVNGVHDTGTGSNPNLSSLSAFFRTMFSIALFLIIFGFVMGKLVFPDWSRIELATRFTLAISISISIMILATFALALMLSDVGKAATIVLFLIGLLLFVRFMLFLEHRLSENPAKSSREKLSLRAEGLAFLARSYLTEGLSAHWKGQSKDRLKVYAICLASILVVVFLMGKMKPRYEPRTDFAFDFSSATPSVQIANHENGDEVYQLIISNDATNVRISQQIHLDRDQTVAIDLRQPSLSLPTRSRLYLDLYIESQAKPYRSLHFLWEELPVGQAMDSNDP